MRKVRTTFPRMKPAKIELAPQERPRICTVCKKEGFSWFERKDNKDIIILCEEHHIAHTQRSIRLRLSEE